MEIKIRGKIHYGWARISVTHSLGGLAARLTGYAYETIPGKLIIAGKTHGPVDGRDEDYFSPDASLTNPIPDTLRPASLGMLALGVHGIPLWRRKEEVKAGSV